SLTINAVQLPPPAGTYYVSDLTAVSATNGWGPVQKDLSVTGRTMSLRGTTYAKGLGVNSVSQVVYNLGGSCSAFQASVGVDDDTAGAGSVNFQVFADGAKLFDSGKKTLTGNG